MGGRIQKGETGLIEGFWFRKPALMMLAVIIVRSSGFRKINIDNLRLQVFIYVNKMRLILHIIMAEVKVINGGLY